VRSTLFIALGLVALLAAIVLTQFGGDETVDGAEQPATNPAPVSEAPPSVSAPPSPATAVSSNSSGIVSEALPVAPEQPAEVAPSFDVVRIDPEGDAVLAGRAPKGAEVTIKDGDTVVGTAQADNRGEWVFLPSQPLETGQRQFTLEVTKPDGSVEQAEEVVVLMVPERAEETIAVVLPREGSGQARTLQTPNSDVLGLSITAVNYDDAGAFSVSGGSDVDADILIYLDNESLGRTKGDARGAWGLQVQKNIPVGQYQLRADHVDGQGKVLNRVTIPFVRAESLKNVAKDRQLVVQPGNSLWRIARNIYGTGFDYTVIYQANKEQISNPDLIYPGQIFELPE